MIQKVKISFMGLIFLLPTLSYAISVGSISDSLSNRSSVSVPNETRVAEAPSPSTSNGNMKLPNPALFIEDAAMTADIRAQIMLKRGIPPVSVTTENAVVSLRGTVETQSQAATLVKIASSVKGVKSVNTEDLKVRG